MKFNRITFFFFLLVFVYSKVIAQSTLTYVPPVLGTQKNADSKTSFVLTTWCNPPENNDLLITEYISTVQIVDANQTWPPRWYTHTPIYTQEKFDKDRAMGTGTLSLFKDAEVEKSFFTFFKMTKRPVKGELEVEDMSGYILLNRQMEPIDTIKCEGNCFWINDMKINAKGERLLDVRKMEYVGKKYLGEYATFDSLLFQIDHIEILDNNNHPQFSWNPVKYLPIPFTDPLFAEAISDDNEYGPPIFRTISASWDFDEDILFAMRKVCIGKISRLTGNLIWQIKPSDLPIVTGNDSLRWISPYDFRFLAEDDSSVTYSLYTFGDGRMLKPGGVVFKMHKTTNQIWLDRYIPSSTNYDGDR